MGRQPAYQRGNPRAQEENAPKPHPNASVAKLTPSTVAKASQDFGRRRRRCLRSERARPPVRRDDYPCPMRLPGCETPMGLLDCHGLHFRLDTSTRSANSFGVAENLCGFYVAPLCPSTPSPESSATTPPGPLGGHGPRICESPIFGQVRSHRGPFPSYSELSAFFNERHQMAMDAKEMTPRGTIYSTIQNRLF